MRYIISIVVISLAAASVSAQADIKKLDAYYAKSLADWGVPGMSIAIVKDGKIVFSKGYGVKEVGKSEKPDAHTLYAIASNTKAFTAAAIAQLVQEGKLSWDDRVRKHVPYFALYDPWVSAQTTIRDILSHRVGLRTFSGDILWYRSTLTAEDIIRRVQYLPKAYDFRAGYGYSNVMYLTAGEVIEETSGKSWHQYIDDHFFEPLGMDRSITRAQDLNKMGNYATPHKLVDSTHEPMPWEEWATVAAMGGIISSVHDMSQWMIFNLNNGVWKNDTVLSKHSRNTLWTPHNVYMVDHTDRDQSTHVRGYALGWTIADYHGRYRVGHTGGYSGMLSAVTLIPDENLGIVILTNGLKGIFTPLINYTVDSADLEHWHQDVWQIKWHKPEVLAWFSFGTLQFDLNNNAAVKGIRFDVPNDDLWFEELNADKIR